MSVFLTKLLSLFVHPLTVSLGMIAGGAVVAWWQGRIGSAIVGVGVLILWTASTPLVADGLQWTLESRFPPQPMPAVPRADAIVTLGGSVAPARSPRLHPDLSGAADRVWHAARLFHADKAPLIIASGGTMPWKEAVDREAPAMQRALRSWGVPADSVVLEGTSSNTYQNATHTAVTLTRLKADRVLLVTSALHMRRALATFSQAGIDAIPVPTDYRVVEGGHTLLDLLPTSGALTRTTAAIREYVGYIVYDWRGWIAGSQPSQMPHPAEEWPSHLFA